MYLDEITKRCAIHMYVRNATWRGVHTTYDVRHARAMTLRQCTRIINYRRVPLLLSSYIIIREYISLKSNSK